MTDTPTRYYYKISYQYIYGMSGEATDVFNYNKEHDKDFNNGILGSSHFDDSLGTVHDAVSGIDYLLTGYRYPLLVYVYMRTGGGVSIESNYVYIRATVVDIVSSDTLTTATAPGYITDTSHFYYADNINDPTITRTEDLTFVHSTFSWEEYESAPDFIDLDHNGYDDRGEHDKGADQPAKPTLFDDNANSRDLNALDPANFSGSFANAGGGDDVVILPRDNGAILRWGLQAGFHGGGGNDTITAGSAGMLIYGDAGNDTIIGSSDHDV